jgi:histidinol-phosphate aminotransferase
MNSIEQLVRSNIKALQPYTSAREQFIDFGLTLLDANENPWGPVGAAENSQVLNRYPDPYQRRIKERLSEVKSHPAEGIFLGNGSDEIIDLLIRIFCEPGIDEIIISAPTYGMYKVSAAINDVAVKEVSLTSEFQLRAGDLLEQLTPYSKIVFLCSPNNPTGNLLDPDQIELLLNNFNGIVVIDEAYIDFADDPGFIGRCHAYPRLLVMQTFSKAWGLAGIRLGVAYTSKEILYYLNRIKPPYNVNQLTQKQALTALEDNHEISMVVAKIKNGRELMAKELAALSCVDKVFPSDANFLLVRMHESEATFKYLIDKLVVVRDRSKAPLCQGCLRITIGTEEENQRLLDSLKTMIS